MERNIFASSAPFLVARLLLKATLISWSACLLDIVAIKQDLEDLLGCKVDVVTEDAVSPYIREQVLKEAVSL